MTRKEIEKRARHRLGLYAFEARCRLTPVKGRLVKAYKVPGTPENGEYRQLQNLLSRLIGEYTQTER